MKRFNQSGSHILALGVALVVLGVVGFTGYTVAHHNKPAQTNTATTSSTKSTPSGSIQSKADLTAAANQLDSANSQVNSSLDDSALNSDLNDML